MQPDKKWNRSEIDKKRILRIRGRNWEMKQESVNRRAYAYVVCTYKERKT
jgi:hypothetical protein